jgi:medium-chain acyl-[acyl-carrier-protein] hydrolase
VFQKKSAEGPLSIKPLKVEKMPLQTDFYTIQAPEVDAKNALKTNVLFDFMQQSASKNAEALGVGVAKMRELNLAWVLNRLILTVERYPKLGETIALSTYPVRIDKYFVYRDFQLHDSDGQQIAHAVSVWLLLDLVKRTMSSVPAFVHDIEYPTITHPLPPMSGKVLPLKTVDFTQKRAVSVEDVDFNDHTSNVSYVKWLVETMPLDYQNNYFLTTLDINYRAESYLNDAIAIETHQKTVENAVYMAQTRHQAESMTEELVPILLRESLFQHRIVRETDGKDLVWANAAYSAQ